jgi:putative PIN family toxin of toxin-antitoxin system
MQMSSGEEVTEVPRPSVVVFDCMTFLQAVARPEGPAAACFRLAESGHIQLAVSPDIIREVKEVLGRPKIRQKNPRLTDESIAAFLSQVVELARVEQVVPNTFAYARDSKDQPYLNLAISTQAAFIVSWDNDLLDLMKDANTDGQIYRAHVPGIRVMTPPDFLRQIRLLGIGKPPAEKDAQSKEGSKNESAESRLEQQNPNRSEEDTQT